jgi:chorismate mutase / prephenate dehydrogenase
LDEIQSIRTRIDEIDQEILLLLKNRYESARYLGWIKQARGVEPRDPKREKIILRNVQRHSARLGLDPGHVLPIFKEIFSFSVQAQRNLTNSQASGLEGKEILVVGGTHGMGRFIAKFASIHGGKVKIIGRTLDRTRRIARELEVEAGSTSDARISDVVVVAVPAESVLKVSTKIAAFIRNGALLTDVSSVKTGIADKISAKVPAGTEYVSIHPLFGPGIDHVNGQNLAAIPFRTGPQWRDFSRAFKLAGARVHLMSSANHDKVMAYVQVLHHFALLSLGVSLTKWDGRLKTSSIRSTLERIEAFSKNWDTTVAIQILNPYSYGARREFVKTSQRLARMLPPEILACRKVLRTNVQKWSRKR